MATRILIELDAIFDTYIASVERCNPRWLKDILLNGYFTRMHNTLSMLNPDVDDATVDKIYKERDVSLLRISKMTNILSIFANAISTSSGFENFPQPKM